MMPESLPPPEGAPMPDLRIPPADATHHDLAAAWLQFESLAEPDAVYRPVYCGGQFFRPRPSGLFEPLSLEAAEVSIAELFRGHKLARRAADYRQIASHAAAIVSAPDFFSGAPVGVVSPRGFWTIGADHRCRCEVLSYRHRQTFALRWEPDFDAECVMVDALLAQAFEGDHAEAQTALFWQLAGAVVFGMLATLQLVALLLGKSGSGKTTLQRLIQSLFPPAAVSAVSPSVWGREYNVASLSGRRLNVVGELDDSTPLPAAAFKNVTGRNTIEGRHPTHRPFYFVCGAAHLFASNVLPPTLDRDEAFFRRWRVLRFSNHVPPERVDPDLVDKIMAAEMPAFLAAAMRGAERVAAAGRIGTTPAHEAVMARWRAAANPVLQYLLDDEWITLDPVAAEVSTGEVYDAYRKWAADSGFRNPFGRNHFLELLDATGARHGVVVKRNKVAGVHLRRTS